MRNKLATILWLCAAWAPQAQAQAPSNVLLVVNQSSPDSITIGRYYALKRSLPPDRLCQIRTEPRERVTRETFEREIQAPVADCLASRLLQDEILYIVTTKGVPLTIDGDAGPVGDLASVDSELALLYHRLAYGTYSVYGRVENPYFAAAFAADRTKPFSRAEFAVYLVTRLTGFSSVDVVFLIDRATQASPEGIFHFDLPSARDTAESEWVQQAAESLRGLDREASVETTAQVSDQLRSVLGYCGLASSDPAFHPDLDIEWNPGALAIALDRDSAASFLRSESPATAQTLTAAHFVSAGVTGFGGQVSDPTLDGQIRPQYVFPAYVSGLNLAESFYRGIRYLSWRTVVVGDPLAAPFADRLPRPPAPHALDPDTGLPAEFARRRMAFLKQRYATTESALVALLTAERLRDQGRLEEALPWLRQSLNADPLIVESQLLTADALHASGARAEAFEHYKRAVQLGNSDEATYRKLADIALHDLKDPEEASTYARWLLANHGSRNPGYLALWAEIQFRLGRLDEAEAYYAKLARDVQPPSVEALAGLARIEHKRENWQRARDLLKQALERIEEGKKAAAPQDAKGAAEEELRELLRDCDQRLGGPQAVAAVQPEAERRQEQPAASEVEPAKAVSKVLPDYPSAAKENGLQGTVVLRLLIDENGQLVKTRRIHGAQLLADAFEKAVWKWKFTPRLVNGKPEPSWISVALHFKLDSPRLRK